MFKIWFLAFFKAFLHSPQFILALLKATPAPFETASFRLNVCQNCNELNFITRQCQVCACFISLKVRWLEEKCPNHKW